LIRRYESIQCIVIANKIVTPLEEALKRFLGRVYNFLPVEQLPKVPTDVLEIIDEIFRQEFSYILALEHQK